MTEPVPTFQVGKSDIGTKRRRRKRDPQPPVHPVKSPSTETADPAPNLRSVPTELTPDPSLPKPGAIAAAESVDGSQDASSVTDSTEPDNSAKVAELRAALDESRTLLVALGGDEGEAAAPTENVKTVAAAEPSVVAPQTAPETQEETTTETPKRDSGEAAPESTEVNSAEASPNPGFLPEGFKIKVAWKRPIGKIDRTNPRATTPRPTTAKVSAPVMRRFNLVRSRTPDSSHTSLLMKALRQQILDLDMLVLQRRPEIWEVGEDDNEVPLRAFDDETDPKGSDDLRIRPTLIELDFIKAVVNSLNEWLDANWPGTPRTTQSEIFTAALDAYLPGGTKSS